MHHPERRGVQKGRDEVAVAADVDTVARDAAETERGGEAGHVDRIGGARDGARPERELVGLVKDRAESVDVAPEGRAVRQEEMRHQHRLGPAEMRVRRHQGVARAIGEIHEARDRARDGALDVRHAPFQVQAEIDRDLLVPRSSRVQAPACVPNPRDQLPLDERVHILVAVVRRDEGGVLRAFLENLPEPLFDCRGVRRGQDAGPREPGRPRPAPAHVVFEQPAIKM